MNRYILRGVMVIACIAISLNFISCQSESSADGALILDDFASVDEFTINFGIRNETYSRADLEKGVTQFFHCPEPYLLKLENNVLYVTKDLYDLTGNKVGSISRNALDAQARNSFKSNYDARALEVVNEHGIVDFRIELEAPNKIVIGGAIKCDPVFIISAREITRQLPGNTPQNEENLQKNYGMGWKDFYLEEGSRISQIFDYSGQDYLGKRSTKKEAAQPESKAEHGIGGN